MNEKTSNIIEEVRYIGHGYTKEWKHMYATVPMDTEIKAKNRVKEEAHKYKVHYITINKIYVLSEG